MRKQASRIRSHGGWWIAVCLILLLQTAARQSLSLPERNLALPNLDGLPVRLGAWEQGNAQSLDENTKEYLHPDEYVMREYRDPESDASIDLFVAYFRTSQVGYGPHSPRICLPGAGWLVRSSALGSLVVPGHAQSVPVNEYVLEKSAARIQVVYWYQNNRAVWADEFWAKLRLLPDLVRYRQSDVALVRIISPVSGSGGGTDFTNAREFATLLFPVLEQRFATISRTDRGA